MACERHDVFAGVCKGYDAVKVCRCSRWIASYCSKGFRLEWVVIGGMYDVRHFGYVRRKTFRALLNMSHFVPLCPKIVSFRFVSNLLT